MLKRQVHAILLAIATLGCASPGQSGVGARPSEIAIGRDAAGSTVALRQGQKLAVSLPANPTAGYVWDLVPGAESILAQQGEPQFTPESAKLGAGGVFRFAFQAKAAGKVSLKFVMHRRFEKEAAPASSFEVTIVVHKGEAD